MTLPFICKKPESRTPLILSSPHSGRRYPEDFGYACPLFELRQAEDAFVDELIAGAAEAGATILQAEFPRSYIDLNRAEDDLDPAVLADKWPMPLNPSIRTRQGLGLVRRLCRSGVPVYADPLPLAAVQKRITDCYRPYHARLEHLLTERQKDGGVAWLIDCHSMPGALRPCGGQPSPDFVVGDRDGTSCDPSFTRLVARILRQTGYRVAINDPYKGVEILRRHGRPLQGRHALQLEISRRLYMDETTLEKRDNFSDLARNLAKAFGLVVEHITKGVYYPVAAE